MIQDALPWGVLAAPVLFGLLLAAWAVYALRVDPIACIVGFTALGALISLLMALWRPFLKLDPPPAPGAITQGADVG